MDKINIWINDFFKSLVSILSSIVLTILILYSLFYIISSIILLNDALSILHQIYIMLSIQTALIIFIISCVTLKKIK